MSTVEQGLQFSRDRAAVLAADVANARTNGFVAVDVQPIVVANGAGVRFQAAMKQIGSTGAHALEYAMGATAKNAVTYRALTGQLRAMLHEFRTVLEEARR